MAGQIVVVSGASSGIGEATAKLYAAKGARVVLLARKAERLARVAQEIVAGGGSAIAFPVDLSQAGQTAETGDRIRHEIGTPDILINNAGAGSWLPLLKTSPAEARAAIELPYLAAFYLTRSLLPEMILNRRGAIACITSPASYLAWPNACAYIAARHALAGFVEGLRPEVRSAGISVTLIVLGHVQTSYWEHNPGSRENVPEVPTLLLPSLTTGEAASTIIDAVARKARTVVRPWAYRPLFLLNALAPRLVASGIRRMARKAGA
jgi:uncharacterized protein